MLLISSGTAVIWPLSWFYFLGAEAHARSRLQRSAHQNATLHLVVTLKRDQNKFEIEISVVHRLLLKLLLSEPC